MKRSTPEHPKLLDLCCRMKLRRWEAVGILESIWHFCAKFAPQGDIGKHTNAAIARAIDWHRDPDVLIEALVASRWLDACNCHRIIIHDWADHADQTLKRYLASNKLAFIQHSASTKKPAQPTTLASASPPLPLPLPLPLPKPNTPPTPSCDLDGWFEERYARHPRKGHKSPARNAASHIPGIETESVRRNFETVHEAHIGSEAWRWKAGARAPFLDEWIIDEGYKYPPNEQPAEQTGIQYEKL